MSYSMRDKTVRKIANGKVYKPFTTLEWWCDPCALPSRRYRIVNQFGVEETLAWWELISEDDNAHDRFLKWAMNREIFRMSDEAHRLSGALYRAQTYGTVSLKIPGVRI